jgi:16S rRNA (cytosine967-C5)-methyltransferase
VLGYSGRSLAGLFDDELIARLRAATSESMPPAVRAELPDWLWQRIAAAHREEEGLRLAQALANPAPLDLRVNLARASREDVLARLAADELEPRATPHSPAGIRLAGKPAINRHPLFKEGLIEVQDEGSQLIAWLLAPRRGEMIADYCAGAGGKTLAAAALMRGTGRIYAFDTSPKRLASLAPRAARAGITNVHSIVLAAGQDARVKRLAGKLDRVLVDAPCSGFGTLRRNPELKWRYGEQAIAELAEKQGRILAAASRLVKPGGRLVYATCSLLEQENEAVVAAFSAAQPEFEEVSCEKLLEAQRIALTSGKYLKLFPHRHGTDAFFAAVFERRKA